MDSDHRTNETYTIAWICALEVEQAAAQGMLDVEHPQLAAAKGDTNSYRFGSIGDHDVVIAVLRSGVPEISSAAITATNLLRSFPSIRFGVMVGVGGGAPAKPNVDPRKDIRLGDVVVSNPTDKYGGVVQYDFGKLLQSGRFVLTGSLNSPPTVLGTAVAGLRGDARLRGYKIRPLLDKLCAEYPDAEFEYPGPTADLLFASDIVHPDGEEDCMKCGNLLERRQRSKPETPMVHYGLIGSANRVLRDSTYRDKLSREMNIMCFEMEAAGLMQDFPCLVIRGICDYCDSHKNKQWQPYAAATAAAYTKQLLLTIAPKQVAEQELACVTLEKLQALIPIVQDIHQTTSKIEDKLIYEALPEADKAAFDSFDFSSGDELNDSICLEGTRVDLLEQIRNWVSSSGKTIFWLSGAPGTGKSTISRTVAQEFSSVNQLGASFFFKQNQGDRGNASRFFTTIAAQLARHIASVRPQIARALETHPRIAEKGLVEQFEKLILGPLSSHYEELASPVLLVIDALDECDGDNHVKLIIDLLSRTETIVNASLRILLTSRPELPIQLGFKRISSTSYENLILQDLPEEITRHDLLTYLEEKFHGIQIENPYLPLGWPGKDNLKLLANMACPLFIFAATICRFVAGSSSDPEHELAIILKHRNESLDQINRIYIPILQRLTQNQTISSRSWMADFRNIVGCIVVAFESFSVNTLAIFLDMEPRYISNRLKALQSVLNVPAELECSITLHHLSFANFLLDSKRQDEHDFWINAQDIHEFMAAKCLYLLINSRNLKQDICDLEEPGYLRKDIELNVIVAALPADVQYACRYWTRHLARIQTCDPYFDEQVYILFKSRFLFWFEALSLLGRASEMIEMVTDLIQVYSYNPELRTILQDVRRFVLANSYVADMTPLQLYSSSIIFAPEQSFIRQHWAPPTWLQSLPRVSKEWSSLLQTLEGHTRPIIGMRYLPSNKLLVSTSHDDTIRCWDVEKGTVQLIIGSMMGSLSAVAYSSDEKLLAVGAYSGNIGIFDVRSGQLRQTIMAHTEIVSSITFSPDDKFLVSSARDGINLKLWSFASETLYTVEIFKGYDEYAESLTFLPGGKVLISGSRKALRVWVVSAGRVLCQYNFDSHRAERLVAFSKSSELLVTSGYNQIELWKVSLSALEFRNINSVYLDGIKSATLSPDGKLLAVGVKGKIKLFTISSGRFVPQRSILTNMSTRCLCFLSDDNLLASSSGNGSIMLWEANLGEIQAPETVNDLEVIKFLSKGLLASMRDSKKMIDIWNVESGSPILQQTYLRNPNFTSPIALASDSKSIAVCLTYGKIGIYGMGSGQLLQELRVHEEHVDCMTFSSNGVILISSSPSHSIRYSVFELWLTSSWQLLRSFTLRVDTWNTKITCSCDGKLLVLADRNEIELWDTISLQRKQRIVCARTINHLCFIKDDSCLQTNLGIFHLQADRIVQSQKVENLDFDLQGSWIVKNDQRLLWIPAEYRKTFASYEDIIALGPSSGFFTTFKISSSELYQTGLLQSIQDDDTIPFTVVEGAEAGSERGNRMWNRMEN